MAGDSTKKDGGGEVVRFPASRHPSVWQPEEPTSEPDEEPVAEEPLPWDEPEEEFALDWAAAPPGVALESDGEAEPAEVPPTGGDLADAAQQGADDQSESRPWQRTGPEPVAEEVAPPASDLPFDYVGGSPTALDEFTHEDYVQATTHEYRGLARAVASAEREQHEPQAVAAAIPGLETGVVGFDDVIDRDVPELTAPERRHSDLPVRLGTAVVLAALFVASLMAGSWWFVALVVLLSILALIEFYSTLRSRGLVPLSLFGLLGVAGAEVAAWLSGPAALGGVLAITIMVVFIFYAVVSRRDAPVNAGLTVLGIAWVSMLGFALPVARSQDALPLILAVVVVAVAFDSAQYFAGRSLGRRPLAPRLSPNKTVEGYIGGVLVAVAVAVGISLLEFFDPIGVGVGLALGLAVAVLGILGDLSESLLKRSIGVKDMGGLLPGHGGILDRIDSLIFAVPAAYVVYLTAGYL